MRRSVGGQSAWMAFLLSSGLQETLWQSFLWKQTKQLRSAFLVFKHKFGYWMLSLYYRVQRSVQLRISCFVGHLLRYMKVSLKFWPYLIARLIECRLIMGNQYKLCISPTNWSHVCPMFFSSELPDLDICSPVWSRPGSDYGTSKPR